MRTTSYSVKTMVLYVVMKAMWNSCKQQKAAMAELRSIYTDDFIDAALLEIAAAEALPDDAQRSAVHEEIRIAMQGLAKDCCKKWRRLKLYIRNSYAEADREVMYTAAGWDEYDGASHDNWPSVITMMNKGIAFIEANTVKLSDGGKNMPDTFIEQFIASATSFVTANDSYIASRQEAEVGTAEKIEANNAIYSKTINMGLDGQECFYDNEELRKQFVFESVAGLVAPAGASGVVITVKNAETNQPLIAEITDSLNDRTVSTDSEGRGAMYNLASGDTTFSITCDGFAQQLIDYTLKTGTTSHIEVMMVPMFASVGSGEKGAGNSVTVGSGENGVGMVASQN